MKQMVKIILQLFFSFFVLLFSLYIQLEITCKKKIYIWKKKIKLFMFIHKNFLPDIIKWE